MIVCLLRVRDVVMEGPVVFLVLLILFAQAVNQTKVLLVRLAGLLFAVPGGAFLVSGLKRSSRESRQ